MFILLGIMDQSVVESRHRTQAPLWGFCKSQRCCHNAVLRLSSRGHGATLLGVSCCSLFPFIPHSVQMAAQWLARALLSRFLALAFHHFSFEIPYPHLNYLLLSKDGV